MFVFNVKPFISSLFNTTFEILSKHLCTWLNTLSPEEALHITVGSRKRRNKICMNFNIVTLMDPHLKNERKLCKQIIVKFCCLSTNYLIFGLIESALHMLKIHCSCEEKNEYSCSNFV